MKKTKKINPIIEIGLVIFIIYLVFSYLSLGQKERELKKDLSIKNQEYEAILEEIELVQEELSETNTLKYIEKIAREDYDMLKPKEVIYKDQDLK